MSATVAADQVSYAAIADAEYVDWFHNRRSHGAGLTETRRRGHATAVEEISPGMRSVAAAVTDHNGLPLASVAVTYEGDLDPAPIVERVRTTAATGTRRLLGR